MLELLAWLPLFAAEEAPQQPPANPLGSMLFPFVLIAIVFYFMMIRPQKRQQKEREDLLNSLKRNDKVVTIGGVIGTIANISADGKEVTVKTDDVKIRFQRSAIHQVIVEGVEQTDAAKASEKTPG